MRDFGAKPMARAVVSAAAVGALLIGTAACGDGSDDTAALHVGDLLSTQPIDGVPGLPSAEANTLITYRSQGPSSDDVVVSGTVAVPRGDAPEGGWPVISWAHGTTGVADVCAPSNDDDLGPAHDYLAGVDATLDRYLQQGYAVVRTDYVGLGTPGMHPYLDGPSEMNAVTDIVRASRRLDPSIGTEWFVAGHSQGGHAALWTAAQAPERAPELNLRGAVAIAPPGDVTPLVETALSGAPGTEGLLSFVPLMMWGAQGADASFDAESLVAPAGRELMAAGYNGCIGQTRQAVGAVTGPEFLKPGADLTAFTRYLVDQSPETLHVTVPTLVAEGTADTVVPEPMVRKVVDGLCKAGGDVRYRTYAGADHREAIPRSYDDVTAFMNDIRSGKAPSGTC